ncbi:MAG: hypothetical protein U0271_34970 [Polyangiaceae bacterium]
MRASFLGVAWLATLIACGARTPLESMGGAGSDAPPDDAGGRGGAGGAGGAPVRLACGELDAEVPIALLPGSFAHDPATVFASNDGRLVSLLHGLATDAGDELDVLPIEPWEAWPPVVSQRFVFDSNGGRTFAVADQLLGYMAVLFDHQDAVDPSATGLNYAFGTSAALPQNVLGYPVAEASADPRGRFVIRGYDSPPVAPNTGYLAALAVWDAVDSSSDRRALYYGIGLGTSLFGIGLVTRPDDPPLACADGPIAAAGLRVGDAWWVFAGSGSKLAHCDSTTVYAPNSIAFDRLDFGPPETADWTVERSDSLPGEANVDQIAAVPAKDGALVWVLRGGRVDRVRASASGLELGTPLELGGDGATTLLAATSLGDGSLVAVVGEAAPSAVTVAYVDDEGELVSQTTIEVSGVVNAISLLGSKLGDAGLLSLSTDIGDLEVARLDCLETVR